MRDKKFLIDNWILKSDEAFADASRIIKKFRIKI